MVLKEITDLKAAISAFLTSRGKTPIYGHTIGQRGTNIILMDGGDGLFICQWDRASLGTWPATSDGFSQDQLRNAVTG